MSEQSDPRVARVAEPGMEAFPPRVPNPHAPSDKKRGGGDMANPSPAGNVWTPGWDKFGRRCWQYKETKKLYYEMSEQFDPRVACVAEPGMETFPPRVPNPHAPSEKKRCGGDMANPSPAGDVWTPGWDKFGRRCWLNRETNKLYYDPSGQSPALPPMSLGDPSKSSSTNEKYAAFLSAGPTPKIPSPLR